MCAIGRGLWDRRQAYFGPGFLAAATFRCEPDRQLVAIGHDDNHHRRPARHFGRNGVTPETGRDQTGRLHAPPAADLWGSRGFGRRTVFCELGLLARQCGGTGRLDLRDAGYR